jgi:hypothetical protein
VLLALGLTVAFALRTDRGPTPAPRGTDIVSAPRGDQASGTTILEAVRTDGVVTRFDRTSGAFLAVNRNGTIRTFFRPNDGERYFHRQKERSG